MGLFANMFGGAKLKAASKKAAAAQIAGQQKGVDELNRQFDVTSGQYQPYQQQGAAALQQQGNLIGTGGADAQAAAIEQLRNSPYFQSLYRQGNEAIMQNAAATGGLRGGNTEASLYNLGADTLSQTIQQQLQNLGGLSQQGFSAVSGLGNLGAQNAGSVANLFNAQGQASAQDILTRGTIANNAWSGLGSMLLSGAGMALGIPGMGGAMGGAGGGAGGFLSGLAKQIPSASIGNGGSGGFLGALRGGGGLLSMLGGSPQINPSSGSMPVSFGSPSALSSVPSGWSLPGIHF